MEEEFFNQRVIVKAQRGNCSRCSLAEAAASIRQLLETAIDDDEDATADEEIATLHLTAATLEDLAGIPHPPGWSAWIEKQKKAAAAAAERITAAAQPAADGDPDGGDYLLAVCQRMAASEAVASGEANGSVGLANGTGEHGQKTKKRKKEK